MKETLTKLFNQYLDDFIVEIVVQYVEWIPRHWFKKGYSVTKYKTHRCEIVGFFIVAGEIQLMMTVTSEKGGKLHKVRYMVAGNGAKESELTDNVQLDIFGGSPYDFSIRITDNDCETD